MVLDRIALVEGIWGTMDIFSHDEPNCANWSPNSSVIEIRCHQALGCWQESCRPPIAKRLCWACTVLSRDISMI